MDSKICVLIALVINLVHKVDASESLLIDFNNVDITNPPSTGVSIPLGDLSRAESPRSFCARFYPRTLSNQRIFQTENDDLTLAFLFENEVGFIGLNRIFFIFPIPRLLTPYVYEHVCFSQNITHYTVVVEGEVWNDAVVLEENISKLGKPIEDKEIIAGPNLGNYNDLQYFDGKLTEINVFSNSFTIDEMKAITSNCGKVSKRNKIFDWSSVQETDLKIPQEVKVETEMRKTVKMCSSRAKDLITLMPFPTFIEEANIGCQAFGAQMLQPFASSKYLFILGLEDKRVRENVHVRRTYVDICESRNWVPVYKSEKFDQTLTLMDYNNRSEVVAYNINDLPPEAWKVEYDGSFLQRCYVVDYEDSTFIDRSCTKVKSCIACLWEKRPILRIRGLCQKAYIEDHYVFVTRFYVNGMIGKR